MPALTGAAAVTLAVAGYLGAPSGVPTVWSPLPLATAVPALWLWVAIEEAQAFSRAVEYGLPVVMGPLLLLAWHPKLLNGVEAVPTRSIVGLAVLSALTVAHFVFEWEYGIKYQGEAYAQALARLNAVALTAAWWLLLFARRRRTFAFTLAAHVSVVAWLVWIACPWLGEFP